MSIRTAAIPLQIFHSNLFSLSVFCEKNTTMINMNIISQYLNTSYLPFTYSILESKLPSVLQSQCFNNLGLPFCEEVKSTEAGHLFEHIFLDYLCEAKISRGYQYAEFSGVTDWNWKKEELGTFHIKIKAGIEDKEEIYEALKKTISLFQLIVTSHFTLTPSQTLNALN